MVANPASSVRSSPANTGRRLTNGSSSRKAAIALPLWIPGGFDFAHHFAVQQRQGAGALGYGLLSDGNGRFSCGAAVGSGASVSALSSSRDHLIDLGEGGKTPACLLQHFRIRRGAYGLRPRLRRSRPCRPAAETQRREQAVELSQRATAYQRARPWSPFAIARECDRDAQARAPARARSRATFHRRPGRGRCRQRAHAAAEAG